VLSLPALDLSTDRPGSVELQLQDGKGRPRKTHALVLEGADWVQVKNLNGGIVRLTWDPSRRANPATVLFGWKGGASHFESNLFTHEPIEFIFE
jgi:hypothetical protein